MTQKLMVIVPDRISDFLAKGEVTDRYYNPGDLFDEVHVVITNDDRPDMGKLQKTTGRAKPFVYNLPATKALFLRTLAWRPWLLRGWAQQAVQLARQIRPQLIRCHGPFLNTFAAYHIKRELGIPYLVSMHTIPDEDTRGRAHDLREFMFGHASKSIERIGLLNADLVMPVYRPIVPFLERLGVSRFEVCYNALNPVNLLPKRDYTVHSPLRVISVGRQFRDKNPDNLIRAVARLPDVHLTLVGDGPYHMHLRQVAKQEGVESRVEFHRAIPNDALCSTLRDYDIFATHTEYWGLPKAILEPLLVGLPVVINRLAGEPVPELTADICLLVDNSTEGYRQALAQLNSHHEEREKLGRAAYNHAQQNWAPARTEAKFAEIYRRQMLKQ